MWRKLPSAPGRFSMQQCVGAYRTAVGDPNFKVTRVGIPALGTESGGHAPNPAQVDDRWEHHPTAKTWCHIYANPRVALFTPRPVSGGRGMRVLLLLRISRVFYQPWFWWWGKGFARSVYSNQEWRVGQPPLGAQGIGPVDR